MVLRGRCSAHGLAVGPEGLCVVCRREAGVEPRSPGADPVEGEVGGAGQASSVPPPAFVGVPPWGVCLGAALLVIAIGAGSVLWRAQRGASLAAERAPAVPATAMVRRDAGGKPGDPQAERETARREALARRLMQVEARQREEREARAHAREEAEASRRRREEETAAAEARRRRAAEERQQALAAARGRVPVTVYVTSWCKACRSATAYLRATRIPFTAHDVEASLTAADRQRALNPRGSVPTLDIDGEVLVGFNPSAIEAAIDRAAERRVDRF